MAVKTMRWDAADYLQTHADMADYLAAAFETGDLGDVTHAQRNLGCQAEGGGVARRTEPERGRLARGLKRFDSW